MDFYTLSDKHIELELGQRIKALRLRRNLTQVALAEATTLSLNSIKSLEAGRGKLSTLVAVLRELHALEQLDNLIPPITISPMQIAREKGLIGSAKSVKKSRAKLGVTSRKRASKKKKS